MILIGINLDEWWECRLNQTLNSVMANAESHFSGKSYGEGLLEINIMILSDPYRDEKIRRRYSPSSKALSYDVEIDCNLLMKISKIERKNLLINEICLQSRGIFGNYKKIIDFDFESFVLDLEEFLSLMISDE